MLARQASNESPSDVARPKVSDANSNIRHSILRSSRRFAGSILILMLGNPWFYKI
jgi:hypothetical protein